MKEVEERIKVEVKVVESAENMLRHLSHLDENVFDDEAREKKARRVEGTNKDVNTSIRGKTEDSARCNIMKKKGKRED